jgi:COMPASS component SWD3
LAHFKEKENQILCLDIKNDGTKFAAAGKDESIRIYDEEKQMLDVEFPPGMWGNIGHSNRIFSLKFHPDDPNFLISGGWDNTLLFWDTREGKSIGSIYGPSICGDTIDIYGTQILTGSYRSNNQLELWDYTSRKKIRDVFWDNETNPDNALIYGCQFSKVNGKTIIAGCSGLDEVRCFDVNNDYKYFARTGDFKHNIFSVDFANNSDMFSYCGTDGHVHSVEIKPEKLEM